jgi:glycosyltransferase involved in cell wall biosynthesis
MNPLLSLIIPTKNRYEYLQIVLEILATIKDVDLEIVIQDNSDESESRQVFLVSVSKLNDSRIKYFYCNEILSINENSDKAVLNSKGKFVCFIGDDDCVTTNIYDAAAWMERESVDVLTFFCPSYIWSDVEYKHLSKKHTGLLSFKRPTAKVIEKDPKKSLLRLLNDGGRNISEMPQLYHGIASRTVLDKIFEKTGSYFPGSVPDMDVAVGLSLYAGKCLKIDVPMVIAGTAKRSAGGLGAAKMHKGDVKKISMLPKDTAATWNPNIPFFWSGPTIHADSISKCLTRTGNQDLLDKFNYNYLYALLFIFHSDYNQETCRVLKLNNKTSKLHIIYYGSGLFLNRAFSFINNRLPEFLQIKNDMVKIRISNIKEVVNYLDGIMEVMTLPWNVNNR